MHVYSQLRIDVHGKHTYMLNSIFYEFVTRHWNKFMSVLKSKMILENISAAISFLINQVLDTSMSSIITITLNGAILIDNAEFFNQNLCILITIAPPPLSKHQVLLVYFQRVKLFDVKIQSFSVVHMYVSL